MLRVLLAALLLATVGVGLASAQTTAFLQGFNGAPSAPLTYLATDSLTDWNVIQFRSSLDTTTWHETQSMLADHGADCAGPPAQHEIHSPDQSIFQCNNHVMTAISDVGGYGLAYLTPPVLADWSSGPVTIQWDLSTLVTSKRDWWDLWITPYQDRLIAPLEDWLPFRNGPPNRAVHVRLVDFGAAGNVGLTALMYNNYVATQLPTSCCNGYDTFLTESAARRDTVQVVLSRTHVKVWMPQYQQVFVDTDIPDLGWTSGTLQFGHHSYNPTKDCPDQQEGSVMPCTPDTWHWDNVMVSQAVPYTILRGAPHAVYSDQPGPYVFTLPSPAPDGSEAMFDAVGANPLLSFDDGQSWVVPTWEPSTKGVGGIEGGYRAPVPTGTQAIQVAASGGWWGNYWMVQGMAVTSQTAPRPKPTLTPIPTDVIPPTVTPVATATPAPTAVPTAYGSPPMSTHLPSSSATSSAGIARRCGRHSSKRTTVPASGSTVPGSSG